MKKIIISLLFLLTTLLSFSQQGIGYFYDIYNRFTVFDKGTTYQLENNPVDSIKVGDNYLAYINTQGDLKVYANGKVETIENSVPNIIVATADVLVYKMEQRLMIYKNGNKKQLASWVDNFWADDSLVVWQTRPSLDILVYENDEIKTIEKALVTKAIKGGRIGRNIFAYSDLNNNFKVYYKGQVIETSAGDIRNYKCGRDIVAFIDKFNNSFNVFEDGEVKTISNSLPKNYNVIDNVISYLDIDNNLIVYYKGQNIKLESYELPVYPTKGNLLVYYNVPELKFFYEGKVEVLEKFINSQSLIIGVNSLLYIDNTKIPKYFYKGKFYDKILFDTPKKMLLYRDLPAFWYGNNTIGFFYNEKMYEYSVSVD